MLTLPPEFQTQRLLLRRLRSADAGWLAELDRDPDVMRFIREPSTPERALADAVRRIEWDALHPQLGLWAIRDAASGEVHGWVGLKPFHFEEPVDWKGIELGFRLRRSSWGHGLAREAGAQLVDYGLNTLRLSHILGVAHADNAASKRVLESLGFRFVRRIHSSGQEWDNFERRCLTRP